MRGRAVNAGGGDGAQPTRATLAAFVAAGHASIATTSVYTHVATRSAENSPAGPDLTALAEALMALPEAEQATVVAHVRALGRLSEAKRAAIMTLTDST